MAASFRSPTPAPTSRRLRRLACSPACILAACWLTPARLPAADWLAPSRQLRNSTEAALRNLVDQADIIFSGQLLTAIPDLAGPGGITLRIRVETPIRNTPPGIFTASFTQGSPGQFPAQPGERFVLFLHTRNSALRTSTIAGSCGLLKRSGGDLVDLRRLQFCFGTASNGQPSSQPVRADNPRLPALTPGYLPQAIDTRDLLKLLRQMAQQPAAIQPPTLEPEPAQPEPPHPEPYHPGQDHARQGPAKASHVP